MAPVVITIQSPQCSRSHIRIRCLCDGLARLGVYEQDWEPFNEFADYHRNLQGG